MEDGFAVSFVTFTRNLNRHKMFSNKYFSLTLSAFLFSVGAYAQTPVEFNKNLMNRADSFFHLGAMWGNKMEDLTNGSKRFEELKPLRIKAVDYLDVQVAELSAMKDVKDSRELRVALMDFFKFEKGLINGSFMQIEKLNPASTQKEIEEAFARLEDASQKEEPYITRLTEAQGMYAKNNGFKPQTPEGASAH